MALSVPIPHLSRSFCILQRNKLPVRNVLREDSEFGERKRNDFEKERVSEAGGRFAACTGRPSETSRLSAQHRGKTA